MLCCARLREEAEIRRQEVEDGKRGWVKRHHPPDPLPPSLSLPLSLSICAQLVDAPRVSSNPINRRSPLVRVMRRPLKQRGALSDARNEADPRIYRRCNMHPRIRRRISLCSADVFDASVQKNWGKSVLAGMTPSILAHL